MTICFAAFNGAQATVWLLQFAPKTLQERRAFADFAFSAVFGNEAAVDRSTFIRLYPHFALHLARGDIFWLSISLVRQSDVCDSHHDGVP